MDPLVQMLMQGAQALPQAATRLYSLGRRPTPQPDPYANLQGAQATAFHTGIPRNRGSLADLQMMRALQSQLSR